MAPLCGGPPDLSLSAIREVTLTGDLVTHPHGDLSALLHGHGHGRDGPATPHFTTTFAFPAGSGVGAASGAGAQGGNSLYLSASSWTPDP